MEVGKNITHVTFCNKLRGKGCDDMTQGGIIEWLGCDNMTQAYPMEWDRPCDNL